MTTSPQNPARAQSVLEMLPANWKSLDRAAGAPRARAAGIRGASGPRLQAMLSPGRQPTAEKLLLGCRCFYFPGTISSREDELNSQGRREAEG